MVFTLMAVAVQRTEVKAVMARVEIPIALVVARY
jgi:hypothetical protein